MLTFQATVHPRPDETVAGGSALLSGQPYAVVRVAPEVLARRALAITFDEAVAALELLDRMSCEPDGSFVWVGAQAEEAWQVDGNCYDQGRGLALVEIKGRCPAAEFDRLLTAFGWPANRLLFEITPEAALLDEAEFRRWAFAQDDAQRKTR